MKRITLKHEQIGDDILVAFCESDCINGRIVKSITDPVLYDEWMINETIGSHSFFTKLNQIKSNFKMKQNGSDPIPPIIETDERTQKWMEEQERKELDSYEY